MISVEDALKRIEDTVKPLAKTTMPLLKSAGFYLAEDVFSPIDSPPFTNSAVDGYAFTFAAHVDVFEVIGEVKAGDVYNDEVPLEKAVRIFTGAQLPANCDTVVMQEHVTTNNNFITVNNLVKGANVRIQGSQLFENELVVSKGIKISAGVIGLLASLGLTTVTVFKKPTIGIIVTGDELIEPGKPLTPGTIYESNGQMLAAALAEGDFCPVWIKHIKDDNNALNMFIQTHFDSVDILLITGGISVGKYDYVAEALKFNQVHEVFYKVKQRPGKPLFFGYKNNTAVFALPGNPASVLTCFYRYVVKTILQMQNQFQMPQPLHLLSTENVIKKHALTWFVKARQNNKQVTVLEGQESYKLLSFTQANGLALIAADVVEIKPNEFIPFISFYQFWNPNG